MPNMHDVLTISGHRFGHQSGIDESSRRNPITCLHRIAFRVYLMFSKLAYNKWSQHILTKTDLFQKGMSNNEIKNACAKPETPQVGFGVTSPYKNDMYIYWYCHSYFYIYIFGIINWYSLSVLIKATMLPLLLSLLEVRRTFAFNCAYKLLLCASAGPAGVSTWTMNISWWSAILLEWSNMLDVKPQ